MNEPRRTVLALAVLLGVAAAGCNSRGHSAVDPLSVARPAKIITVEDPGHGSVRTFPGKVKAAQAVDLAFRVGGPLINFPVSEGRRISQGGLIARIDPRDYEVKVRSLEAQLAAAKAQRNRAELHFGRVNKLYERKSIARAAYDEAKAANDVALAQEEGTTEALRAARLALEDTKLLAPYDGVVAARLVENHQNVKAGEPIVHFQETRRLEVVIHLPERAMTSLTSGSGERLLGYLRCPATDHAAGAGHGIRNRAGPSHADVPCDAGVST